MSSCATAFLACFISIGCQSKIDKENQALWQQNRELQADKNKLQSDLASRPDPAQMQAMQQQIAERDAKIADLQNQLRQPPPVAAGQPAPAANDLQGIEVTRDEKAGTVTVNLPGDVLFNSGQSELKSSAKTTLNKVAAALQKDYPGKRVIVKGYTDTDPISRTKDKYKDNLDLSAERARTVAEYLHEQGISNKQLGLQAYGDTMPRKSKDRSRRVEIVVSAR
jgi:outer membrane protein OmpA-like peptidoglycan-associated protein